MNRKEFNSKVRLINETFSKLDGACGSTKDWSKYLDIIRVEEKKHRIFTPDGLSCGLTVTQSVKLFAIKEIFDRFVPNESGRVFTPKVEDYFAIRASIFAACSIANTCREEIQKTITFAEMQDWLAAIDYAELNKDPRQLEAA